MVRKEELIKEWRVSLDRRMMSNNALERTVGPWEPRLAAARRSWSAAQLSR